MSNGIKATNIFNTEMLLDPYNTYCFLTPHHQMRDVMREATRLFPTLIVTSLYSEGFIKLEEVNYAISHGIWTSPSLQNNLQMKQVSVLV
jgi:hypothetical protein